MSPRPLTTADLRELVTIQLPVVGTNEAPGTPTTVASSAPAAVQAEVPRQGVVDASLGGSLSYKVILRYRSDVTRSHEIVWGDKTLRIIGLWDLDGLRRWLVIRAVETT